MTQCRAARARGGQADEELRRQLADSVEIVDGPPADVALVALDGHVDDAALTAIGMTSGPARRSSWSWTRARARVRRGTGRQRSRRRRARAARASARGDAARGGRRSGRGAGATHHALTGRRSKPEKQILAMVVLGCTNPEIATKLVVTESTVKNHLSRRSRSSVFVLDPRRLRDPRPERGLGLGVLRLSADGDSGDLSEP